MLFQLSITLAEEDYFAYNYFHSLESVHGKRMVRRSRIFLAVFMMILIALITFVLGFTAFSIIYAASLGLCTVLYILLYKKRLSLSIKAQMRRLKKIGKLPFEPISVFEFHDDKIVERTEGNRTELNYQVLERICIVQDRYIILYRSSVSAYILPTAQVKAQVNQNDFLSFLTEKCNTIENY